MRGKSNYVRVLLCTLFLLGAICTAAAGEVIYLDADATGVNNGSSWANAHWCLQDALADAQSGDEIRVAQGIYKPDREVVTGRNTQIVTSGDRTATFQLKNGVTIKGDYAGFGEPDPDARDIKLYDTFLSGDLNGDDGPDFTNYSENSYHVVNGAGTVNFYWKVSSEKDFDFLKFYIDGSLQDRISGSVDWQQMTYTITDSGLHTLEWRYVKDKGKDSGSDCGWVDEVEWVTTP